MKNILLLLYILPAAIAASVPNGHQYIAPTSSDQRSPCPGLNSLANHGYLPRSGKGITVAQAITGLKQGLNVGADFSSSIGGLATLSNANPLALTFNLGDLKEHNFPIEHDGSLSRADYYSGNDYSFNMAKWQQVLNYYAGATETSLAKASNARYHRIQVQRAIDGDKFIYGPRQLVLSYGETALYLSTMGDPVTGIAQLSYVNSLFQKERLPYELGWTPPKTETNLATLGAMIVQLQAANPEALPEGLSLGEGALRDVYELKDPITGILLNATCLLAGTCS